MAPWLIWIAMAVLAAAAALPLLAQLYRARRVDGTGAHAAAVYRDQLAEVDRDLAAGVIGAGEAEAARTEIARRLIKAGGETAPTPAGRGGGLRAATAIVLAMPVAAFALYLLLGAPDYPDQPLAARTVSPETADVATLIAAVEARLAAEPGDGAGWDVIAPVYLRLGRANDAAAAYGNAIRILGATAAREAGLGEAIVAANGGMVTEDARGAFLRAAELAPQEPLPRFYLALALQQDGRRDEALAAWRALLADASDGATWAPMVAEQIATLETAPVATPGPSAEDVAAAETMAPEEREAMIEGMVASLAARLADSPEDPEGWARLVRSYMVLGRPDDARAALAEAREALAGDGAGLALVEAAAIEAGVQAVEGE